MNAAAMRWRGRAATPYGMTVGHNASTGGK